MAHSVSTGLFFILTCGLWAAKARQYNSVLIVPNGGRLGEWGSAQFCYKGHAVGFLLKVDHTGSEYDATALNGISLLCDDGGRIASAVGPWGIWSGMRYCSKGKLVSFALKVQEPNKRRDETAANNIVFHCSDNTKLIGDGYGRGSFGPVSNRCVLGSICGIQTRVHMPPYTEDDTALNDVRFFCCE